jgi:putative peptidoglycan binding protein
MRTLLVSICCLSLACFAGAAQQQQSEQDNPNPKGKKGQPGPTSQQVVAPAPHVGGKVKYHTQGNVSGAGAGAGANVNVPQNATLHTHKGKLSGQTQTNLSGQTNVSTKNTTFNKTVNKNITVNKNFKVQKFNLSNNPNPKYKAVKFSQNYKIAGANKWKGSKYQVFVNYQPQWHDQYWWTSHHNHIVFVFGSPYYWDTGYWYPCWGYNPGATFYFDGPIYASNPEYDPGQVVANVQSALQQQGYYQGEIDGILGPQTRAALAEYQSAQGLEPTGAVDEPTLETLGMV